MGKRFHPQFTSQLENDKQMVIENYAAEPFATIFLWYIHRSFHFFNSCYFEYVSRLHTYTFIQCQRLVKEK